MLVYFNPGQTARARTFILGYLWDTFGIVLQGLIMKVLAPVGWCWLLKGFSGRQLVKNSGLSLLAGKVLAKTDRPIFLYENSYHDSIFFISHESGCFRPRLEVFKILIVFKRKCFFLG